MSDPTRSGTISHMGPGYSDDYLALPIGRGVTVRLCGPESCRTMTSNDVGPDQRVHPDRIADVSVATFEDLCGVPASAGLCEGSWTVVGTIAPPETDTAPVGGISLLSAVLLVAGIVLIAVLVVDLALSIPGRRDRSDAERRNRRGGA